MASCQDHRPQGEMTEWKQRGSGVRFAQKSLLGELILSMALIPVTSTEVSCASRKPGASLTNLILQGLQNTHKSIRVVLLGLSVPLWTQLPFSGAYLCLEQTLHLFVLLCNLQNQGHGSTARSVCLLLGDSHLVQGTDSSGFLGHLHICVLCPS